jgi:hypothetical protein
MPDLTRRQLALIIGGVLAVLAIAVGGYGLINGPQHTQPSADAADSGDPRVITSMESADPSESAASDPNTNALPHSTDPVGYARAVASRLFDWDSSAGYLPVDFQSPVVADADPSGEETPGLITDIASYFPGLDQWLDLATMHVTQTLTIDSAEVPVSWGTIAAQAHGELRPGTTAVTITGTRKRAGLWNGQPSTTTAPVEFTVFVACRPTFDRCHLLRLSELGNPLR